MKVEHRRCFVLFLHPMVSSDPNGHEPTRRRTDAPRHRRTSPTSGDSAEVGERREAWAGEGHRIGSGYR
jgi:hypothetical protein